MKVALLSFLFDTVIGGGASAVAETLARELSARGHQVVVITTHPRREIIREQVDGYTIYRFLPYNLYWVGDKNRQPTYKRVLWQLWDIWNPHSFRVVHSILDREQPDIVHVIKMRGLSTSVWHAARVAGVGSVVQTCQDYELMSPEGTLSGRIGSWAYEERHIIRVYQWIRARLSRSVSAGTAPSRYTLQMLTDRGFFADALKRVVPNSHGLTETQLARERERAIVGYSKMGRSVRFLYLGRLENIKGVDWLCAAFRDCVSNCPNAHLSIAGWGTLESDLRCKYASHPQIAFRGPVAGAEKTQLLRESDMLIVPSLWPEVFGIVIVEAYAHGKPVIAAASGGIPELVGEETGLLVQAGDQSALTEALCCMVGDPSRIREMVPACFEAARNYSRETVTDAYLTVYAEAISRDSGVWR